MYLLVPKDTSMPPTMMFTTGTAFFTSSARLSILEDMRMLVWK